MINSAAVEANANVKVELPVWASSSDVLTLRLRTRSSADDPRDARLQGAMGAPGNRTNAMTIRPRGAIFHLRVRSVHLPQKNWPRDSAGDLSRSSGRRAGIQNELKKLARAKIETT